ncbi:MAG: hypothetical protein LBF49_00285 [Puniceicoccales bacterium]|jgi:hypothetical protein|nr:hypothetical protein [Puniceicoccales bacterium]
MQVRTSDGKALDNFERLHGVVQGIQGEIQAEHSQSRSNLLENPTVTANMPEKIPGVLDKMLECHCNGRVYSQDNDKVFSDHFIPCISLILAWLFKITQPQAQRNNIPIGVTVSQMKDVLLWLVTIMKAINYGQINDRICVDDLIHQLRA